MNDIDVSVIIPVHNAGLWLEQCLGSVLKQQHTLTVEVSLFLDSCTDTSEDIVQEWSVRLENQGYVVTVSKEDNINPKGVGYAKNKAVQQSHGKFLCFLDSNFVSHLEKDPSYGAAAPSRLHFIQEQGNVEHLWNDILDESTPSQSRCNHLWDDVMMSSRIQKQYELAFHNHNSIVGSRFRRDPPDSTFRYTKWANGLTAAQLMMQIYTSHGPTVIMPTWFCHRDVFHGVGGFSEAGAGTPEDLIFFFTHLTKGGQVVRHDEELLIYRYHPQATTFSIDEQTIWDLRVREIQVQVLSSWQSFTIWNAGKQGRKFYRSLTAENQKKVTAFCDVDVKKIGSFYTYEESKEKPKPKVPIIHFKEVEPPLIICMKLELTGGVFEENLASMQFKEGIDYFHFN